MEKINDSRLTSTMSRCRNGRTQVFTEGDVEIRLSHEKKEMYASLIEGEWYWVSGCGPCIGRPRGHDTYIECEIHDVCRECSVPHKELDSGVTRWGGSNGWICGNCEDANKSAAKAKAFEALDGEDPDCTYMDSIVCPHCGSIHPSDDIHESTELECYVCEGLMELEVEYTASYTTSIKGDRVIV